VASFNRVVLLGNLTRDVELKHLQSGTAVAELGLAINEKYKDASGQWVESTVFVDISLWGRTAEIAGEYLAKGDPALIEGRLKFDQWEKDGKKQSKLRVTGEKLQLLSRNAPPEDGSQQETRQRPAPAAKPKQRQTVPPPDDDVGF